ncbi:hypothetical protein FSP39_014059 [Pinctada imbricata]|uniref:C2H2-type domain-containing protein n=1 Tax=Pinctada imbricata TaxID=66713 RepID=A0AA88Y6F5_PINIB|nr:hypothetical protein FSP39_014059 [Pinctada imbricata]
MAEHFASCRPKEGMIRCRICWQIFKDKNTHQAHMERHRQRSEKTNIKRAIIICKICKSKFESKEMLINHVITSHPDRMESYPMQTGRSSDGILKCKSCYKEFYSKESFALHQASHIEKVHKCETCRARFSSTYSLKLHSKIHLKPGQAVLHECKVCHKTFLRPNSLSIHMFAHRSTKDFSCSECGKSFRLKASLRSHLRVHNKFFFYICKCGEKFRSKSTFRNHIVAYHREDKTVTNFPIYKCEYCQKEFVSKHRYMEHTSFHTGRKTFSCSLCSSKFATQGKLNWHINRVHMTKKKFICKVCDLSSENETKFKKHLQTITHIEECKAANIELKQFYDDLEALEKGSELSEPRFTFDVIYESSENGKERKEINVKRKDCSICKKKFITVKALHNHRRDKHTHCSVCNENFKSPMSFQKHIGRKSHMETCKNKGIDPEAFLFCFKSDGILEEGEQPEEDTDFESLTAIGGIDGSKISNDVTQLMDHQYQTHEGITQSTTELPQNIQGTSQNNTSLRSILPSNQPKPQSATNLKVQSPNVKVITVGNQLASPRSLLKTSHNKNVTTINIQGTSGNVQVQKTPQRLTGNPGKQQVVSQSLLGASQTPIVASQSLQGSSHSQQLTSQTQSQQLTSHSLLGASQIPGTGQGEGPLIIAEGLQEVENYVIEDSAVIAEAQQAVEVLGSMNDDNMEYVLITIPNDSLTVREDGTYLLNDTILGDVLK